MIKYRDMAGNWHKVEELSNTYVPANYLEAPRRPKSPPEPKLIFKDGKCYIQKGRELRKTGISFQAKMEPQKFLFECLTFVHHGKPSTNGDDLLACAKRIKKLGLNPIMEPAEDAYCQLSLAFEIKGKRTAFIPDPAVALVAKKKYRFHPFCVTRKQTWALFRLIKKDVRQYANKWKLNYHKTSLLIEAAVAMRKAA